MHPIHLEQTRFQRTDEAASAMAEHRRLVREARPRRAGEHRTRRFSRQVAAVPMLGRFVVGRDCGPVR